MKKVEKEVAQGGEEGVRAYARKMKGVEDALETANATLGRERGQRKKLLEEMIGLTKAKDTLSEKARILEGELEVERKRVKLLEEANEEMRTKFSSSFDDISQRIEADSAVSETRYRESQYVKRKLLDVIDKYESREEKHALEIKSIQIELELFRAKHAKAESELASALAKNSELTQLCMVFKNLADQKDKQLTLFESQFDHMKGIVDQTNGIMGKYQDDVNGLHKTIKKLTKENANLEAMRAKDTAHALQLATTVEAERAKNAKLESLCRALQERARAAGATDTGATDGDDA